MKTSSTLGPGIEIGASRHTRHTRCFVKGMRNGVRVKLVHSVEVSDLPNEGEVIHKVATKRRDVLGVTRIDVRLPRVHMSSIFRRRRVVGSLDKLLALPLFHAHSSRDKRCHSPRHGTDDRADATGNCSDNRDIHFLKPFVRSAKSPGLVKRFRLWLLRHRSSTNGSTGESQ